MSKRAMGTAASDEKRPCVEVSKRARSAAASVVTLLKDIDAAVCDSRDTLNLSYLFLEAHLDTYFG